MDQKQVMSLLEQQQSRQWGFFLQSLTRVLAQQLDSEDLHQLMHSIGVEAVKEICLDNISTLVELESQLNHFWTNVQWGSVTLEEGENVLHISHYYSPLVVMFDEEALKWVTGFLEGFYQAVFQHLGAGDGLKVRCITEENTACLHFLLGV